MDQNGFKLVYTDIELQNKYLPEFICNITFRSLQLSLSFR